MSELSVGSLSGLAANSFVIDVASGSLLTQPGMILQVIHFDTGTTTSTTSTSYVDTSITATITPSATSSKILIQVQVQSLSQNNTADASKLAIFRGTVAGTELDSSAFVYFNRTGTNIVGQNLLFLDTPNTTSAQTYTIGIKTDNASNTAAVSGQQNIVLMEVAG